MGDYVIRLPDVGEGVAEAELVEWHVAVGDVVAEDSVLAAVMTDKATVEIPSPVQGEIAWLGAEVGDIVAVGSDLVRLQVAGPGNVKEAAAADRKPAARLRPEPEEPEPEEPDPEEPEYDEPAPSRAAGKAKSATPAPRRPSGRPARPEGEKPIASPAVRKRARDNGVDLRQVVGSGPAGRITHEDLDLFFAGGTQTEDDSGLVANTSIEEIKVVGLRRKIAEKMTIAKTRIPHITYVEEVDVTALEELRAALNRDRAADQAKLTLLPFLARAMVKAIESQPALNALYDDEAGIVRRHGGVHVGIAAQTAAGLMVPVVRHAEALDIWAIAAEIARLSEAAKDGSASREELTGSTITITSLGALGGLVSTPVINYPEVAIIGVNKMQTRPVWDGTQFIPRKMMNLSSAFDHRIIDGWEAATFIQSIKGLLETPAKIFMES